MSASKDDSEGFEEKVAAEIENAKGMKISEMKMFLQSKGILTSTFCEKDEFVKAYAEAVVKDKERKATSQLDGGHGDDDDNGGNGAEESKVAMREDDDDDGEANDVMVRVPEYIRPRIDKLKSLHEQREELMKEYLKERAQLEKKYQDLTKPLYEKRHDVVLGKLDDVIAKEYEEAKAKADAEGGSVPADEAREDQNAVADKSEQKSKGIPQFWVCALGNMEVVAVLLTERDIDCLEHLEDIKCEDFENGEGFTLYFHFSPNDYFENTVLTKKYEVPNLLLADEPILKDVAGCEIKWKPGRALTTKEVTKKQRGTGKNAGQVRTITTTEKAESFFHFFTPPKLPSLDTMNEAEADRLESAFDEDYDIAQAFRSHIIPKAVLWFTGRVGILFLFFNAVAQTMERLKKSPHISVLFLSFVSLLSLFFCCRHPFPASRQWSKKWRLPWKEWRGLMRLE